MSKAAPLGTGFKRSIEQCGDEHTHYHYVAVKMIGLMLVPVKQSGDPIDFRALTASTDGEPRGSNQVLRSLKRELSQFGFANSGYPTVHSRTHGIHGLHQDEFVMAARTV